MKKIYATKFKAYKNIRQYSLLALVLMACSFYSYGQSQVPFSSRATYSVNGDFTIIGNANLTEATGSDDMIYVDIDGDPNTVNSSSATVQLTDESGQLIDNTSNIVYAGLYWTGRPPGEEFIVTNPNTGLAKTLKKPVVSINGPSSAGYTEVTANTGDIYYPEGSFNDMYIAFADVTSYVQANGAGEYTVADIALVEGQDNTVGLGIGYYGAWSMVIVYENSTMRSRNIGVFDGYSFKGVPNDPNYELLSYIDLDISGLNTADYVNAQIGVMGAEGDADLAGDALTTQYGGTGDYIQRLSHSTNTTTNFFNSSINVGGSPRTPNGTVYGIDLSKFDLPEVSVVPNQNNLSIQYTATTDKYVIYNLTLAFETVTLPEPPEDATYECLADVPVMEDLIADDICSDTGGTITSVNSETTNASDPCNIIITRTWSFTDSCGDTSVVSQTINLVDTTAPVAPEAPADITVACLTELPADLELEATDNCGDIITAIGEDTIVASTNGGCNQSVIRTWTFSDDCGNTSEISQNITVIDDVAPVFIEEPQDIVYDCDGEQRLPTIDAWVLHNGYALANDNCSDLTWTNNYNSEMPTCNEGVTVEFTATDACGNSISQSATYTILDETGPIIETAPEALVMECNEDYQSTLNTWLASNGGSAATDACSTEVTWSNDFSSDTFNMQACGEDNATTVIFTATDLCGNITTTSSTITVIDVTAPTVPTNVPEDVSVECYDDIPEMINLTATDECVGEITVSGVDTEDNSDPSNIIITRTWTFTDACGNTSEVSQIITVSDITAPVIDSIPADLAFECIDDVPAMEALTAIDNCSGIITSNGTETINDADACNLIITRTWVFTDDSGNSTETTQTITVIDDVAPTAPAAPEDVTVQCSDDVPAMVDLTATDNCGGEITSTGVDTTTSVDTCSSIITRTWSFTDSCGNTSTATQIITVIDTTAPVITNEAADIVTQCDGLEGTPTIDAWVAINAGARAEDNCSDITWTNNYDPSIPSCTNPIEVIFTATDACGNSTSTSATYIVNDETAPVIDTEPQDLVYECNDAENTLQDWLTTNGGAVASDYCSDTITWSNDFDASSMNSTVCGEDNSVTVTFTAVDNCGNAAETTATITIIDETAPTAPTNVPADVTVECDGDVPAMINLTATDECTGDITVAGVDTEDNTDPLNIIITRTWTFSDACGNTTEVSQIITVKDVTSPVVDNVPTDTTYACIDDVPELDTLTATDNCTGILTSDGTETIEDTDSCNVTITRTWMFTDNSGNTTEVTQTISVIDDVAPTAPAAPEDVTIQCSDDVPAMVDLTATDNCGGEITSTGVDTTTSVDTCSSIITRTWSFTDSCGNTSTTTQIITVADTIAPTLVSDFDSEVEINCSELPAIPELEFTDNCSSTVEVEYTEESTSTGAAFENYLVLRDWTVTDSCGNTEVFTQTITVNVQQDIVQVFDDRCTEGGSVDLDSYLEDSSIDGTWIVESGETTINGSTYDPINSEVGATYVFTFTEANGCQNQTSVSILINEDCVEPTCDPIVSSTVTPNGDQWNEYFTVTGLDRCGFVINIEIYNRWGALVYKATDYQNNWNGKNDKGGFGNASNLPTGTYYYIVTLKNSGLKPLTGSIYLGNQ
ncbi:gliding motility-associated C-terminal domain-containing protein [Formosa sp. L2A11]|uniref:gliding motility-associated C-terminal domain-containing protein n=1 Tax=Formosa sp. L2A11 TaxID=2686363 RepID=UPI00131BD080|nr:gliding motility-associated C-terminal domain-containing protein [Formosa sp. L2A11]